MSVLQVSGPFLQNMITWHSEWQAKPAKNGGWLRKVALDCQEGQARVHTGKIPLLGGLFRLQVVAVASRDAGFQLLWKCASLQVPSSGSPARPSPNVSILVQSVCWRTPV